MTIAQTAIDEIKRRMQLTAPKPKPRVNTVHEALEAAEDEDFRRRYQEAMKIYPELAAAKKDSGNGEEYETDK